MNHYCKKIKAFTLAEVLITLLIIGVIASLIVPNLINDTQEAEFHTAWKKAYSDLDQATRRIVLDNGGSLVNICAYEDDNCLRNLYTAYLSTNKICLDGQVKGSCWHDNNGWRNYNNSIISSWGNSSGIIQPNGNLIRFETWIGFPDCTNNTWVNNIQKCAFINVDINGFKPPNTIGRDIYLMILTKDRLLPVGITGDGANDCNSSGAGYGCAAKFLYQ